MSGTQVQLPKLPFWELLSGPQKETVADCAVIRHYEKGSMINGDGNACLGMIYVLKGSIRIYILSEEGREITLFRLEKDDTCVLSASCVISQITFDTQIVVEKSCDLLVVNSGVYSRIVNENIYVKCFTYELTVERFSSVMWTMQQILFEKVDRRIASFLISEYNKTGNAEIHMTHEQIAQQISSAREVVARMLKRFVSDGLVEMKRGTIKLKDIERLGKI